MEVRDFDEMSPPENGSVIIGKHFPPMMLIKKKSVWNPSTSFLKIKEKVLVL